MYVMMAILGAANLVPWMAFLAMADFFRELYGSNAMEFYFPIVSTSVLVVTSALTLAFGDRYPFRYRIVLPTLVLCFSILAVPLLSIAINARLVSKSSAFRLTLASVLVNAFCSSVAQATHSSHMSHPTFPISHLLFPCFFKSSLFPPTHPFLLYVAPHFSHISHFNLDF